MMPKTDKTIYYFFIASVPVYLLLVVLLRDYSVDDAFVTFRYAENIAAGHGFVFNIGDPPVEGYSNSLWLALLTGLFKAGLPVYMSAKILGVLFFFIAAGIWLVIPLESDRRYRVLPAALFLAAPLTAFWAVSGLELGLYAAGLALYILAVLRGSYFSLLPLPLVALSRPEGPAIVLAAILLAWFSREKTRRIKRLLGANLLILVVTTAALVVFRLVVFGYPMPNTYYAKIGASHTGLLELGKHLLYFLPLTVLFIWGMVYSIKRRKEAPGLFLCGGLFIVQAVISCMVSGVMNFNFRYLIVFLPAFLVVAVFALSRFSDGWQRRVLLVVSVAAVFVPIVPIEATVAREKKIIAAQDDLIFFINWESPDIRISLTDVGRIPYYTSAGYNDIWGLVSADIAHEGFSPLRELLKFPDFFVFVGYVIGQKHMLRFGGEQLIYRTEGFKEIYQLDHVSRPLQFTINEDTYHYLVFRRDNRALDSVLEIMWERSQQARKKTGER